MTHRAGGLYRILERPGIYTRFQSLLGGPAALRRFIDEFVQPSAHASVLDVGCGTGVLLDYLPPTVGYAGYDMNEECVQTARIRHEARGRFFCARVGEEPPEIQRGKFDLVIAIALLHHLSDDDADRLVGTAHRLLMPGGSFVSIDNVLYPGQNWLSGLLTRLDRGGAVRTPEGYRRLITRHFPGVEDKLMTDMLRVPYSHFLMRATKEAD